MDWHETDAGGQEREIHKAHFVSFSVNVHAHCGDGPHDGPVPIALSGVFHPEQPHGNTLPGRYERTGRVGAALTVSGQDHSLSALGKAHEQTQTAPRFGPSFTYAMLLGPGGSLIGLLTKTGSLGDFDDGGANRAIHKFAIEKWAPQRRLVAALADRRRVEGTAETRFSYQVSIYRQLWQGHIVRARIGAHDMVGMINDWKPNEQPYGLV